LLRGLRTLPLRLPHHMKSALTIAERLKGHGHVERVNHPPPSPTIRARRRSLAIRPVLLRGDRRHRRACLHRRAELFRIGVSWGGHESLVVPALASLQQTPDAIRSAGSGSAREPIRLNIGLENVEDLWADVIRAFESATRK
jgi:cystathionine beta-lyase/cystathionine gamma-synthase